MSENKCDRLSQIKVKKISIGKDKVEYLGVHLWSFELNAKGVMTSPNLFNNYGMINYVLKHNNDIYYFSFIGHPGGHIQV